MSGLDVFLAELDYVVEVFSHGAVQFLWHSSILIGAVWGMCRIIGNKLPSVRRALWITSLCVIPLLPLITIAIVEYNSLGVTVDFTPLVSPSNGASAQTAVAAGSGQSSSQPLFFEEPVTENTQFLKENIWAVAFVFYCLGLIVMSVLFATKVYRVYSWRRGGRIVTDSGICESLKNRLERNRSVRVFQSDEIPVPMVVGTTSPSILLPACFLENCDGKTLDTVLAHECAHIARKDNIFLLYAAFVQTVLYFHPLVWFAVNRLALSMEETADSAVMNTTGIKAGSYASMLFGMAVVNHAPATMLPFSRNHNLLARITGILNTSKKSTGDSSMRKMIKRCLFAAIGCILVFGQLIHINCGTQKTTFSTQESLKPDEIYMTVYGTVLDPDGKPVAGAAVDAMREAGSSGGNLTGDCRYMVISDDEGRYRISFPKKYYTGPGFNNDSFVKRVRGYMGFLRRGGIVLEAHPGTTVTYSEDHRWYTGFLANGLSTPIKLTRGTVGPVTIRLTRGATVSGMVYDGDNNPMPRHEVGMAYHDRLSNRYFRPRTVTDDEGRFTLTNIRPGKIWLTASQPYSVFDDDDKSPYPENVAIVLDMKENENTEGLRLRGMTHEEGGALFYSLSLKERRKSVQVY